MEVVFKYLAYSGMLTVLLWVPYILARVFVWGLPTFLHNYPAGYPQKQPEPPLWAIRAHRAHLNMVETLPAFIAVTVSAVFMSVNCPGCQIGLPTVAMWSSVFFWSRVAHAAVYILGIPFLRTPVYLISWASILAIGISLV